MTHIKNIPHILKNGITHRSSLNSDQNYQPIGDIGLISTRDKYQLPNSKMLGSYIPFYFGKRMPMLYVIKQGFNNVQETSQEDIVYCITTVYEILNHGLEFIFTNGHSVNELTTFYSMDRIKEVNELIDKNAVEAKYWKDDNDLDLKRRKEAEFLIYNDIPLTAILGYAVYNLKAKEKLIALGVDKPIIIKESYYF